MVYNIPKMNNTKVWDLQLKIINKENEIKDWHKSMIKRTNHINDWYKESLRGWGIQGRDEGNLKSKNKHYQEYINYCVEKVWILQKEINALQSELSDARAKEVLHDKV